MKNITLAFAIVLGFCATEAGAQRRNLLGGRNRSAAEKVEMTPEEKAELELWSTWPKDVFRCRSGIVWRDAGIVKMCEEEFQVVFRGENNNGWRKGCGKNFVDGGEHGIAPFFSCDWKKYNSDGILMQAGSCEGFEEYVWMTNCAAHVTIELQKKWAEEHSMTYEDAKRKYRKYEEGQGKVSAEGRARREEELAAEKAEREKEREEQRLQLMQIQEELRKAREVEKSNEEK